MSDLVAARALIDQVTGVACVAPDCGDEASIAIGGKFMCYPHAQSVANYIQLMGCVLWKVEAPFVERLAEAAHNAWMAEKQRQGFADHTMRENYPGECYLCGRGDSAHHPDCRPYADLSETTKEYDRATVRAVLDALREWPGA